MNEVACHECVCVKEVIIRRIAENKKKCNNNNNDDKNDMYIYVQEMNEM